MPRGIRNQPVAQNTGTDGGTTGAVTRQVRRRKAGARGRNTSRANTGGGIQGQAGFSSTVRGSGTLDMNAYSERDWQVHHNAQRQCFRTR
jgi:hypothetical protein